MATTTKGQPSLFILTTIPAIMDAATQKLWFCSAEGCGRSFGTRSAAYRHRYSRHEGRRFPCSECTSIFAQKDSLNRHRLVKHLQQPDTCGDTPDVPLAKRQRSSESISSSSSSSSTASSSQTEVSMMEDDLPVPNVGNPSLSDILRPPSPASPITRGYIRPPKTVAYKPSSNRYYYGEDAPRIIINGQDDLPVPARVSLKATDTQGSPRADHFQQASYSYKTLAQAIYKLEDSFYPKCCLRGERHELKD